jgi:hypothetical protein
MLSVRFPRGRFAEFYVAAECEAGSVSAQGALAQWGTREPARDDAIVPDISNPETVGLIHG